MKIFTTIYVANLPYHEKNMDKIKKIKLVLKKKLYIIDLSPYLDFIGMAVTQECSWNKIYKLFSTYIRKILYQFKLDSIHFLSNFME